MLSKRLRDSSGCLRFSQWTKNQRDVLRGWIDGCFVVRAESRQPTVATGDDELQSLLDSQEGKDLQRSVFGVVVLKMVVFV